ncbi:MAG: hypothetical protein JOZ92_04240, partial [Candidatus Dormibacteraeota bacterium]|nr:hypothetical protein [Candidatus Dormibacteraeota bacterium]
LGSSEGAGQRASDLQEAIERLADSRRGVTAAAAVARLKEALAEVGTERRAGSPLGAATLRLRDLDRLVADAHRKLEQRSLDLDRLRRFDEQAAAASRLRKRTEAEWLAARLAAVEDRLAQLQLVEAEHAAAQTALAESSARAAFPLDLEPRICAIAGELNQAELTASEAGARANANTPLLAAARSRRLAVDAGLAVVAHSPQIDPALTRSVADAGESLNRLALEAERVRIEDASGRRVSALRHEIAGTGLGALPVGAADSLADLLQAAHARGSARRRALGGALALAAGLLAVPLLIGHHLAMGALAAGVLSAVLAAVMIVSAFHRRAQARIAEGQMALLEESLGVAAGELAQVRDRVPALQALHAALLREETAAAGRVAEREAVSQGAAALLQRCEHLSAACGIAVPAGDTGSVASMLERCRVLLERATEAVALGRRRTELEGERERLDSEIGAYQALLDDEQRCRGGVARLRERLDRALADGGLPAGLDPEYAAAAVSAAAGLRRRHDEARRTVHTTAQRAAALGDRAALETSAAQLRLSLADLGLAPRGEISAADESTLHRLDDELRHATQAEMAASGQARELRARLDGALEGLPELADLEDERDECSRRRRECLRRQAALLRAIELVERAAKGTHRDLAPRLSGWVAEHLDALTESRYRAVNVDTDHFAVQLQCRDRPDMIPLDVVSHGTRDQVSLLLRLALCEALSSASEPVPLLLDEPLLTADPARRMSLLQFLHNLSATHQVVLSTADPSVADAARDVTGGR